MIDLQRLKKKLDVDAEISRSVPPELSHVVDGAKTSGSYAVSAAQPQPIDSLAVLPFANVSADPNTEYLSDGITESIINTLSRFSGLRVMARSTVFRYKGREVDASDVGRELKVGRVLAGRVLQFGDHLIIRTELVDTADGRQLWGEQYNRKPADILAVQDEIARDISEQLRLRLTSEQRERMMKRYTENTDAYQAYLKGRYFWSKRTEEALKKGIEHFQQAAEIDPSYALAYVGLADCYTLLGAAGYNSPPPGEAISKAKQAATKALQIDDALAEAHASLAFVSFRFDWNWPAAESEFKCSVELNPNYPTARQWYAVFLSVMGRHEEAIQQITRAQEIDPLSLSVGAAVGRVFHFARQYERAIEQFERTLEMDPNFAEGHFDLGLTYMQELRYEEAIAEFKCAIDLSGGRTLMRAILGRAYAMSGRTDEARAILRELTQLVERGQVSSFVLALIFIGLGENDLAFESLERAYAERFGLLVYLKSEPLFDALRPDSRFTDLMRRVGLTP